MDPIKLPLTCRMEMHVIFEVLLTRRDMSAQDRHGFRTPARRRLKILVGKRPLLRGRETFAEHGEYKSFLMPPRP